MWGRTRVLSSRNHSGINVWFLTIKWDSNRLFSCKVPTTGSGWAVRRFLATLDYPIISAEGPKTAPSPGGLGICSVSLSGGYHTR